MLDGGAGHGQGLARGGLFGEFLDGCPPSQCLIALLGQGWSMMFGSP